MGAAARRNRPRRGNWGYCENLRVLPSSRGEIERAVVFEDAVALAFLDDRPLFPGHTMLVPKQHYETLADLAAAELAPLFAAVRLFARAVEEGLGAGRNFCGHQ